MAFQVSNGFVGLGIEGTRGTLSSAMKFIPVTSPQTTPQQTFLRDSAFRGSPVATYDHVAGVGSTSYDAKFNLYSDTFPLLSRGILGGTDAATASGGKYLHAISLLNAPTTGSQPPSISIQDFDGANTLQILAAQMSTLSFTFGAEAAAEVTTKLVGNLFTNASAPTPTFGTVSLIPGWNIATTIGGTSYGYVSDGEITIERSAAPIFTGGQQGPKLSFAGPVEVTGRITLVTDTANDPFLVTGSPAFGMGRSPQATSIVFTDPATSDTITVQMSAVQFHDPKRNRGKNYVETEVSFTANANVTDSGGTGYSPIKISTLNSISTPF
jgi:hypothetical protein